MKFGSNKDINRAPIKEPLLDKLGDEKPKKGHQETLFKQPEEEKPVKTEEKVKKSGDENDLIPLFAATGLVTYLVTKYAL